MGGLQVLGRTYRHLNRYREVAAILAKHGFGDLLHTLRLDSHHEAEPRAQFNGANAALRRNGRGVQCGKHGADPQ